MKNKKLVVCLIILAFLVAIIVVSSTIFSLSNVELIFASTTDKLSGKEQEIVENSNIKYGGNVLFLNKTSIVENIEKSNPYAKVVSIETVFPNSLKIYVVERVETYAIEASDNSYLICDEEFKVLKKVDKFVNSTDNAIILNGLKDLVKVNVGEFLKVSDTQKPVITQTFNSLREWDLSYNNLKAKIDFIKIDSNNDNQIIIQMRSGVQIVINGAGKQNSDKINLAFSVYDNSVNYQQSGIIEIRIVKQENDYVIKAFYNSTSI